MAEIELSIVIPAYNEEQNIEPLYFQLKKVLDNLNKTYEIIFVDDGSTDNTFEVLEKIYKKDKKVRIIKFRRNFGQTAALDAGFKNSKGEVIVAMDADLQNDPEDIPRLLEKIEKGYDVMSGWRYNRRDDIIRKISSTLSNILVKNLTKVNIHDSGCTLKAYKKECFNDIELYGEMHRFIPSLLMWKGFKVGEIKVKHHPRKHGKTKYGLIRILKGFLDLLVVKFWMQYSARPIHLFGGLGVLLSLAGFLLGVGLIIARVVYSITLTDKTTPLLSIFLMILGVQFFISGILADISIKTYYGLVKKKNYNIDKILR